MPLPAFLFIRLSFRCHFELLLRLLSSLATACHLYATFFDGFYYFVFFHHFISTPSLRHAARLSPEAAHATRHAAADVDEPLPPCCHA